MASSLNNPAWVEWMVSLIAREPGASEPVSRVPKGGVSRQSLASTFPPDRFYCLLDELPLHLVPAPAWKLLQQDFDAKQPLFLNPDCVISTDGQLPESLLSHRNLLAGFALQGSIAWIPGPTSTIALPFWLGPQLECLVRSLTPGKPVPASVSEKTRRLLAQSGILVPDDLIVRRPGEHEEAIQKERSLFQERGYAPIASLIHPFHVAALRRYYRHRIRTGTIPLGDGQSPLRYAAYNEPVARFFHHAIAGFLSEVVGEPIEPSYVYFASYRGGAELKKHTDRAQCEFSVTLCLDFAPEPQRESPWPIRLDTKMGTNTNSSIAVYQALGDGLAYRGTRVPHYRDKLPEGQSSTSIFFHYVPADFAGPLG